MGVFRATCQNKIALVSHSEPKSIVCGLARTLKLLSCMPGSLTVRPSETRYMLSADNSQKRMKNGHGSGPFTVMDLCQIEQDSRAEKEKKQILWIFLSITKTLSHLLSLTPHFQLFNQLLSFRRVKTLFCFGLMDCVQMSKHPKHVPYLYLAQPDNTAYFVATDSGVDKLGEMQCIYNRMFSHLFQGNVAPCSLNSQLK